MSELKEAFDRAYGAYKRKMSDHRRLWEGPYIESVMEPTADPEIEADDWARNGDVTDDMIVTGEENR